MMVKVVADPLNLDRPQRVLANKKWRHTGTRVNAAAPGRMEIDHILIVKKIVDYE
jgi:NAD(P)-dependent dehydrogenase (short-subunit alcohol dehydrogenase family)